MERKNIFSILVVILSTVLCIAFLSVTLYITCFNNNETSHECEFENVANKEHPIKQDTLVEYMMCKTCGKISGAIMIPITSRGVKKITISNSSKELVYETEKKEKIDEFVNECYSVQLGYVVKEKDLFDTSSFHPYYSEGYWYYMLYLKKAYCVEIFLKNGSSINFNVDKSGYVYYANKTDECFISYEKTGLISDMI